MDTNEIVLVHINYTTREMKMSRGVAEKVILNGTYTGSPGWSCGPVALFSTFLQLSRNTKWFWDLKTVYYHKDLFQEDRTMTSVFDDKLDQLFQVPRTW